MMVLTCCLLFFLQLPADPGNLNSDADYLYWIELTQLQIAKTGDWGVSGEISPLIGLEPGRWMSPLNGLQDTVKMSNGKAIRFSDNELYLPRQSFRDGRLYFFMSILDRDDTTPDDLLLPARKIEIDLTNARFTHDAREFTKTFRRITEINTPLGHLFNTIEAQFRITRRLASQCNLPKDVFDLDAFLRQQNEIRWLRHKIFHFLDRQLVGGNEVGFLVLEGSADNADAAKKLADLFAESNLHEVTVLKGEVGACKEFHDFSILRRDYLALLDKLKTTKIQISILNQKEKASFPVTTPGSEANLDL